MLVTGGENNAGDALNSSELYDPSTGDWTMTGNMTYPRYDHTASILTNGQVLVTGGQNSSFVLNSTELYDPSTGNWTMTGNMNNARYLHTASILTNGTVSVTGGQCIGGGTCRLEKLEPHLNLAPVGSASPKLRF